MLLPDHHYHQGVLTAQIRLTFSHHTSLLAITLAKFSWQHPWVGFHRRLLLMSSSLLPQQCPACLAHLPCMVCKMGSNKNIKGQLPIRIIEVKLCDNKTCNLHNHSIILLIIWSWILEEKRVVMLNIDLKIPLTCHVNCVGGIIGNAPFVFCKQDSDAPEVMCKLCGWHTRRVWCWKQKNKRKYTCFLK